MFLGILREKQIRPERVELKVIDDEEEGEGIFEPVGVREVLGQLAEDLNYLTIYTERPAYFYEFTETMYEENGLIVELFSKKALAWSAPFSPCVNNRNALTDGGFFKIFLGYFYGCHCSP